MSKKTKYQQLQKRKRVRGCTSPPVARLPKPADRVSNTPGDAALKELHALLASLALNAWRAKRRLAAIDTEEMKGEARRTLRHIEAIIEALEQVNLKIIDYPIGSRYDIGMPVKVIASEPTPQIKTDRIIDVVKPGIEYKGKLILPCEIIIGTPIKR